VAQADRVTQSTVVIERVRIALIILSIIVGKHARQRGSDEAAEPDAGHEAAGIPFGTSVLILVGSSLFPPRENFFVPLKMRVVPPYARVGPDSVRWWTAIQPLRLSWRTTLKTTRPGDLIISARPSARLRFAVRRNNGPQGRHVAHRQQCPIGVVSDQTGRAPCVQDRYDASCRRAEEIGQIALP